MKILVPGTSRRPAYETMRQPRMIRTGCLEVLSRVASRSVRVASRSHRGLPRGLREQTLRPKWSILGVFLALPTKTSFTTSQNYPKYEVWAIEILCGRIPLRLSQSPYPLTVKYLQGFYRNGDLLNVLNATFGSLAMQQSCPYLYFEDLEQPPVTKPDHSYPRAVLCRYKSHQLFWV